MSSEIEKLQKVKEVAQELLNLLGECEHHDHHGYCQTHFVQENCSVKRLREAINNAD